VRLILALALVGCGDNITRETCAIDGPMCKQLSSWELFEDLPMQKPVEGVYPYDLNTPLFSDYASKDRFVRLPDGATAAWSDSDALALPVGSVLVKTFGYYVDRRYPGRGKRLLETRVLVHGETGWHGAAYVYDQFANDAELAIAGSMIDADWIHDDGAMRTNAYVVPNQNQCKLCHAEHDDVFTPVGPKVRHLRPADLETLVDTGVVTGAPPRASWPMPVDAMNPASGTLDERARAWLDINCGFCHNPRGAARTSGLFLDHAETVPATLGVCKPPVATGRGSGGLQFDIVPGQPDQSILIYRIESTEPDIRMPELGRNLVHAEGVALMREWITAMAGSCAQAHRPLP
jgi:uncharacterized repeat protein (TIGR03806 family)